jgi:hypothetical protein
MGGRVPNIPGFYMLFRAWSHWRAYYGAKHLQVLVEKNLVLPVPDGRLEGAYASAEGRRSDSGGKESEMLLDEEAGVEISKVFEVPEMLVEIERAIEQVDASLKKGQRSGEKEKEA